MWIRGLWVKLWHICGEPSVRNLACMWLVSESYPFSFVYKKPIIYNNFKYPQINFTIGGMAYDTPIYGAIQKKRKV
jgi:hypothetical protein